MRKLILGKAKDCPRANCAIKSAFARAEKIINQDFTIEQLDLLFFFHEYDVGQQRVDFIRYPHFIKIIISEHYFPTSTQLFATILQAVAIYCTNQKLNTNNELLRTIINTGTGLLYARKQVGSWKKYTIKPAVFAQAYQYLQKIYSKEMEYSEEFWFAGEGEFAPNFLSQWSALAIAAIASTKNKSFLKIIPADLIAYLNKK